MKNQKQGTEVAVTTSPAKLLEMAIGKDVDIEKLKELMDLQERWDAQQAKKSYYMSLSKFQNGCPPILKTKAGYDKRYYYAPLDQIIKVIKGPLFKSQLTYRWEQAEKDGKILVTCIITHVDGHSEQTTLESAPDSSGGKNTIQSKGSAVQYLRRYTLESVLGIATSATDNDGNSAPTAPRAKKPSTSKAPKKINQKASEKLLLEAKLTIDEYSDRMELKKNSIATIQEKKVAGMHQEHSDELQRYINDKFVSLGKPQSDSVELP